MYSLEKWKKLMFIKTASYFPEGLQIPLKHKKEVSLLAVFHIKLKTIEMKSMYRSK